MPPRSTKKPPASAARATRPGRGVAAERSPAKPTPAKQYRQIDGVRYDDKALGVADDAVKARGKIVLSDARKVFESVLDGPGITRVEYDTLAFVANGTSLSPQHLAAHHLQHLVGVVLVTLSALLWAYSGGAHARRDTAARVLAEVFDAATPPGSPSRAASPHSPAILRLGSF